MKPKGMICGMPHWKYWQELRKKSKGIKRRTKPLPKQKKPIPKKASHDRGRKKPIPGLVAWYDRMIEMCRWVCEECGESAYSSDKKYQIAAQAHLLPKEHFRSIATDDDNCICLGPTCGCHRRYDKNWESARKMKVWPACERVIVEILIPKLTADEFKKLPDFLKYVNPNSPLGNSSGIAEKETAESGSGN